MPQKLLLSISLILYFSSYSQVSISGMLCVRTETEYEYKINGSWNNEATMEVCLEGGVLSSLNTNCYKGVPLASIKIKWNGNTENGVLLVNSSSGNTSTVISIAAPLNPGTIRGADKEQTVTDGSVPAEITASAASGGGCSASYSYQWQESDDNVKWKNVKGETNPSLRFSSNPKQTTYYRRRVTDSTNTIGYSDVAVIVVPSKPTK